LVTAPAQFLGDIAGNVLRPLLCGIEGDDTDRAFELPVQEVLNDPFQIGPVDAGFSPNATQSAESSATR